MKRRRIWAGLVAAGVLAPTLDIASTYAARTVPPSCGAGITLLSANLLMVHPDPPVLAAEILAADADILAFQEYSPRWEAEFGLDGLMERYPHRVDIVRSDSFGTAIWSRVPLLTASLFELTGLPQSRATVQIGAGAVEILNVHTLPPRSLEYLWPHLEALDEIGGWMEDTDQPFIVTGDFNAGAHTAFAARARRAADDAWELAGRGPGTTWPNGVFPLPPMRLDHIYLSRDLTVEQIHIGTGSGSDHRPLRAVLAPRAGGRLCLG